jgi:hypothetical protein
VRELKGFFKTTLKRDMPVENEEEGASGSSDEEEEQQSTKVNELEPNHQYFQGIEMCKFCKGEMVTG